MRLNPLSGSRLFQIVILLSLIATGCADRTPLESDWLALLQPQDSHQSMLVLGDSLTEYSRGFGLSQKLNGIYSVSWLGAPNRDIPYWSTHITEALAKPAAIPNLIVFPMGTNDAYSYTTHDFIRQLHEFHAQLRQYTSAHIIYCQMPRTLDTNLQARILQNNASLSNNLPTDRASLVDLDEPIQSFEGGPGALYPLNDPIHPLPAGNEIIGEQIEFHILSGSF